MESLDYHQVRIVELETEVRLLKEQLAQAYSGTSYLVNCFAQQQFIHGAGTEQAVRQLEGGNAQLRQRLQLNTGRLGSRIEDNGFTTPIRSQQPALKHDQTLIFSADDGYPGTSAEEDDSGYDLISFDEVDNSPTAPNLFLAGNTPSTTSINSSLVETPHLVDTPPTLFSPEHHEVGAVKHHSAGSSAVGLGISNVPAHAQCTFQPPHKLIRDSLQHRSARVLANTPSPLRTSVSEDDINIQNGFDSEDSGDSWQAIRPSPKPERGFVFDKRFLRHEHNYLMGLACFLEDKSAEELEEEWQRQAGKDRRHSPEEWRTYYEEVVRPTYLRNMEKNQKNRATAAMAPSAPFSAGTERCEEAPVSAQHKDENVSAPAKEVETSEVEQPNAGGLLASKWATKTGLESKVTAVVHKAERHIEEACTIAPAAFEAPSPMITTTTTAKSPPGASNEESIIDNDQDTVVRATIAESEEALPEEASTDAATTSDEDSDGVMMSNKSQAPVLEALPPLGAMPPPRHMSRPPHTQPNVMQGSRGTLSQAQRPWINSPSPLPRVRSQVLFQYGSPNTALYRTVIISNIPKNVSLAKVLSHIRGGKIVNASYALTAGMKTVPPILTNTALVQFFASQRAAAFVEYCKTHLITLLDAENTMTPAKVTLLQTPTRPLPSHLQNRVRHQGLSRTLFLVDSNRKWTPEFVANTITSVTPDIRTPLAAGRDESGILWFEFSGVWDAAQALRVVDENAWIFESASKGYWPDQCDVRGLEVGKAKAVRAGEEKGGGGAGGKEDEEGEAADEAIQDGEAG